MPALEGKVIAITGASRGLGQAYALAVAKAGARVVVNGTNAALVDATVQDVRRLGAEAEPCVESVASMAGGQRIVATAVEAFSRLDVLVNNAGNNLAHTLPNLTEEEWDEVIAVHVKGTFACTKAALPVMQRQGGGRIINTFSRAMAGSFGMSNYAAAKAAIAAMTWSWARELAKANIMVNAIRPTATTGMSEVIIERARKAAREKGLPEPHPHDIPPGFGTPEELAPLVVYLASDAAQGLTGLLIGTNGRELAIYEPPREVRAAVRPEGWGFKDLAQHFRTALLAPAPQAS